MLNIEIKEFIDMHMKENKAIQSSNKEVLESLNLLHNLEEFNDILLQALKDNKVLISKQRVIARKNQKNETLLNIQIIRKEAKEAKLLAIKNVMNEQKQKYKRVNL